MRRRISRRYDSATPEKRPDVLESKVTEKTLPTIQVSPQKAVRHTPDMQTQMHFEGVSLNCHAIIRPFE